MTEQPPPASKEALGLLEQLRRWSLVKGPTGNTSGFILPEAEASALIDALIAQRVSAETERCAGIVEEMPGYHHYDVAAAIRVPDERPAPEGPQPKSMIERWEDTQDFRDATLSAFEQQDSSPSALPSTGEQPAPPAAVADDTERATRLGDILASRLMQVVYEFRKTDIAAALASEHAALLERLREPDVREAVKAAMRERDFARDGEYLPDDCYEAFADAALTKIAEMLKP